MFCDSLEVYDADWTSDFLDEFQKRRGYDFRPLLPVAEFGNGERADAIRRDYGRTLNELFDDRFGVRVGVEPPPARHGAKHEPGAPVLELSGQPVAQRFDRAPVQVERQSQDRRGQRLVGDEEQRFQRAEEVSVLAAHSSFTPATRSGSRRIAPRGGAPPLGNHTGPLPGGARGPPRRRTVHRPLG